MVYLRTWNSSFDDAQYDYYAERLDWSFDAVYSPINVPRLTELAQRVESMVPGRRALDVGCGAGQWAMHLARRGWDARGIDLSSAAVKLGRRHGAPIDQTDLFHPSLDGERFDLITMWELIEHVPDSARFVGRARQLLSPKGVFVISTPNFSSIGRRVLGENWLAIEPKHHLYFEPRTLRTMLTPHFGRIRLESRGVPTRIDRAPHGAQRADQKAVRTRIQKSRVLGGVKRLADAALARILVGDTLLAWCTVPRPRAESYGT